MRLNMDDVLKIHSVTWNEDDIEMVIEVSLLGSEDIDKIVLDNDGLSYHKFEKEQSLFPLYVDAPGFLYLFLESSHVAYQQVFRSLLMSAIYPVFYPELFVLKKEAADLSFSQTFACLTDKINTVELKKERLSPSESELPPHKLFNVTLTQKEQE